jgi:hypothetical protein
MEAMNTAERVRQEMRGFEASVPRLKPLYADRWVVFRDGEVVSAHDTEEAAYRAGLASFGRHAGHVIAKVAELRVVPLRAAVAYQCRHCMKQPSSLQIWKPCEG